MKNFMLLLTFVLSGHVFAETLTGSIHSINRGQGSEPHIIRLKSGEVMFVEQGQEDKLSALEALQGSSFEASINKSNSLQSISGIDRLEAIDQQAFAPTVVSGGQLQEIFARMNENIRRRSECSDRAHVWSYDEFKQSGVQSEKVFLFLTDTYIRKNRYKWWFHVAPLYTVNGGAKMVMDKQFLDRPVTAAEWKNLLVFSKRECVMDFAFNAYNAGADQSQDCYMKFVPMYYHFPAEIGAMENGTSRTMFNESEVSGARNRAFMSGSF